MENFQKHIHYTFKQKQLLLQAVTHSSYANEHKMDKLYNNERLEFLGDAVLEIIKAVIFCFHHFPKMQEGQLSKKKSQPCL